MVDGKGAKGTKIERGGRRWSEGEDDGAGRVNNEPGTTANDNETMERDDDDNEGDLTDCLYSQEMGGETTRM